MLANNCGSERHRELIEAALPPSIPLLATLARSEHILPERHLGLVQADEVKAELEQRFEAGADALEHALGNAGIDTLLTHAVPVDFYPHPMRRRIMATG